MSVFRLLLILLLCVQAVVGVVLIDVKEWFPFFLINSLLLLLQLLVLKLVFKIKNEAKKVSLLNGAMGVGDVFFFFFLAEAFSPLNFVAFLVLSLIVSLLFHYLFRRNQNKMPLIGYLSLIYMLTIPFIGNSYDDTFLLTHISAI